MQNVLQITKSGLAGVIVLLVLLVSVRIFQEQLFYDPFLTFFRGENYRGRPLPEYDSVELFSGLLFRYVVNSVLSLAIIWLFFKDKAVIKLSAFLYAFFFAVLTIAFFLLLNSGNVNLMVLFYVRRFLIQPLFLILFIPAFYYQRKSEIKSVNFKTDSKN